MIANKGYIGNFSGNASQHPIYQRWTAMIRRCYNPKAANYKSYGAKGVYVEDYLLSFSNFVEFLSSLPHYKDLLEHPDEWQIDKDINGGNCYSRKTIKIVKTVDNIAFENKKKKTPIYQILSEDKCKYYESVCEAESATGIHKANISRAAKTGIKAGGYFWRFPNDLYT